MYYKNGVARNELMESVDGQKTQSLKLLENILRNTHKNSARRFAVIPRSEVLTLNSTTELWKTPNERQYD